MREFKLFPIRQLALPLPVARLLSAKRIALLAWGVAAVVVAWVTATLAWWLLAPEPAPEPEPTVLGSYQATAQAIMSRHLFGIDSHGADAKSLQSSSQFRLLGAMTGGPGKPGFAILAADGRGALAAVEGETFADGVTLLEVLPDRVRLKVNETVETVDIMKNETNQPPGGNPQPLGAGRTGVAVK